MADNLPGGSTANRTPMSIGEAAIYLGVSVATVRRWCDEGKLPYWRTPGGQRRFEAGELQAWLSERSVVGGALDGTAS